MKHQTVERSFHKPKKFKNYKWPDEKINKNIEQRSISSGDI